MSRSYKRNPIFKITVDSGDMKKVANRKVRRFAEDLPSGSAYKKLFNSEHIHNWIIRQTYGDLRKDFEGEIKAWVNGGVHTNPFSHFMEDYSFDYWCKDYRRK